MTVSEYLPFYDLFHNFDYFLFIDKEQRSLKEVFENYEDYELSNTQLGFLEFYDSASLSQILKDEYFTPENVVVYLRDLFDTYRKNGGNPLDWLDLTFESINLNPTNYRAELRGTIEKSIVEWIDIFSKQPIDYLYLSFNPDLLPPQQAETKTNKLKAELITYGFFELSMVKQLSEPNKQSLVELISKNGLPYSIAMIEYLGFLKHLKAEHFTTDYKLFKAVADWFKVAERAVKGNIYVLNKNSKENKERYTADQHRQTVQNDYQKLI
jgi:hypothetical protein